MCVHLIVSFFNNRRCSKKKFIYSDLRRNKPGMFLIDYLEIMSYYRNHKTQALKDNIGQLNSKCRLYYKA
jgi:hypothetical protein